MTDRLGIGGNNPPASEAMALHVEDLFKLVSDTTAGAEVSTDEQEAALDNLLDDVRQARKDAEAKRVEEKEPHLEAGRAVDAAWKPITTRCDAAADEIKRLLTPYRVAKQAAKDAAAAKARQEAEERSEAARQAHLAADTLEARYEAETAIKSAAKLATVAKKIDREPTGLRTRQVAVVTDYRALLLHIANTDKPALDAFLEEYARKALPAQLPGTEIETQLRAA
jgi:hypothetical protein